jgi:hypothetical protein
MAALTMDNCFYVSTTIDELIEYYKENGITDYPKKKDGTPNMGRSVNKNNLRTLIELKSQKFKRTKMNAEKMSADKISAELTSATELKEPEMCVICNEPFEDICILKCKHKFCVNCAISHFRVKHNCPLCREEICSIPKTTTAICDEYVEAIAENVFNHQSVRRNMMTMKGYLSDKLGFYKRNNVLNIESYINEIQGEIMNSVFDISDSITDWYVS